MRSIFKTLRAFLSLQQALTHLSCFSTTPNFDNSILITNLSFNLISLTFILITNLFSKIHYEAMKDKNCLATVRAFYFFQCLIMPRFGDSLVHVVGKRLEHDCQYYAERNFACSRVFLAFHFPHLPLRISKKLE